MILCHHCGRARATEADTPFYNIVSSSSYCTCPPEPSDKTESVQSQMRRFLVQYVERDAGQESEHQVEGVRFTGLVTSEPRYVVDCEPSGMIESFDTEDELRDYFAGMIGGREVRIEWIDGEAAE